VEALAFPADFQFCVPSAILPRDIYRHNFLKLSVLVFCLTTFQITETLNWALMLLSSNFQEIIHAAIEGKERNAKIQHSLPVLLTAV